MLLGDDTRLHRATETIYHHLGVSDFASHAVVNRKSVVLVGNNIPPEVAAVLGCAVLTGGGAVINAGNPSGSLKDVDRQIFEIGNDFAPMAGTR